MALLINSFRHQENTFKTTIPEKTKSDYLQRIQKIFTSLGKEALSFGGYLFMGMFVEHNFVPSAAICAAANDLSWIVDTISTPKSIPGFEAKETVDHWHECIAAPFIEEPLFRIGIQYLLLKRLPEYLSKKKSFENVASFLNGTPLNRTLTKVARMAITASLFGLYHLPNKNNQQVVSTAIEGFFWGALFELFPGKRGLFTCMGAHLALNMKAIDNAREILAMSSLCYQK